MHHLIKKPTNKRHSGETIVEVLLSIAILSSVLGLAFATASRSSKSVQANKERYQALLLANEQASFLKLKSADDNIRTDTIFCFKSDATYSIQTNADTAAFDAGCKGRGTPSVYDINIQKISTPSCTINAFCTYSVVIEWDSVKGSRDRVEVYYAV